jgi:predicted enzyme related to lactoylglutathione lyase
MRRTHTITVNHLRRARIVDTPKPHPQTYLFGPWSMGTSSSTARLRSKMATRPRRVPRRRPLMSQDSHRASARRLHARQQPPRIRRQPILRTGPQEVDRRDSQKSSMRMVPRLSPSLRRGSTASLLISKGGHTCERCTAAVSPLQPADRDCCFRREGTDCPARRCVAGFGWQRLSDRTIASTSAPTPSLLSLRRRSTRPELAASWRQRGCAQCHGAGRGVIVCDVDGPFGLIEFPADEPDRARRFWSGLLGIELAERSQAEGRGWQTHSGAPVLGIHERGLGPGDTASLPYFTVPDMAAALEQVTGLGGSVIHPGTQWAICRDSEGSPFGLALASRS